MLSLQVCGGATKFTAPLILTSWRPVNPWPTVTLWPSSSPGENWQTHSNQNWLKHTRSHRSRQVTLGFRIKLSNLLNFAHVFVQILSRKPLGMPFLMCWWRRSCVRTRVRPASSWLTTSTPWWRTENRSGALPDGDSSKASKSSTGTGIRTPNKRIKSFTSKSKVQIRKIFFATTFETISTLIFPILVWNGTSLSLH